VLLLQRRRPKAARDRAVELVQACGLGGLHGGALCNSAAAEALTSVLIFLNKTYAVDGAGVRITGDLQLPKTSREVGAVLNSIPCMRVRWEDGWSVSF
jgi:hypothetical protein